MKYQNHMNNPFQKYLLMQLTAVLFVVFAIIGLAYMCLSFYSTRNFFLETTQKLNAQVAQHLIHEVSPFQDGQVNQEALGVIMHSMMAVNPSIEVYLLGNDGQILSYVVLDKKVKLTSVNLDPIQEGIRNQFKNLILGDDPRNPSKSVIFSAAPVKHLNQLQGYVYMVLESEEQEAITTDLLGNYFFRVSVYSFFLTLMATFLVGVGLIYFLLKRLKSMHEGINKFQNGDFQARIEIVGDDELTFLAKNINLMSDRIMNNIEELKKVDVLRRELIANVSHDLRSPMTVIHGYVETFILKQNQLSTNEQKQYLEAILHNSNKLNKLVNDLFELTKLEAKQITINREPVLLNEMLNEICSQFAFMAERSKINFQAQISTACDPIPVDSYLLNRAIQNVMDNAIKYANQSGRIEVNAMQNQEIFEIVVANTGKGILAEDLPHVFDRYYKSNNRSGQSTGLGLAITKKIVDMHGGQIHVQSQPGALTSFRIQIPYV
jgi:signal transduction histidine kinase